MDIYTGVKLLIILGYFILGVNVIGMALLWGRILTLETKMKVYVASESALLSTGQSLIWDALGGRKQMEEKNKGADEEPERKLDDFYRG